MVKTLTKHGNSLALVIDKPILDLLNIKEQTELDVSTDGHRLIIAPTEDAERRRKFKAALAETNRKYGKMLKRLAD